MKNLLVAAFLLCALVAPAAIERPTARLRGFNLLEMFIKHSDDMRPKEFRESDFQMIRDWGFNFVRLPMDYRFWIKDGDWDQFDESALQVVDRAVALGRKYGIHVAICMHRAPGYTVAKPSEKTNLFTDPEPLRVAAKHWAMFARRYKGISSRELSFNLFNEPPDVKDEVYGRVAKVLIEAIRKEDPTRFILADGLAWGNKPVQSLVGIEGVGQSTRGYAPMSVSHYLAPWAGTPSAPPVWPLPIDAPDGYFGGPYKREVRGPFTVADLPPCRVKLTLGSVSGDVTITFKADGKVVAEETLHPEADNKLWSNVKYHPEWQIAQGRYLGALTVALPSGAKSLSIEASKGDWAAPAGLEVLGEGSKRAKMVFSNGWQLPKNFQQVFRGFDAPAPFMAVERVNKKPRYADPGREYLAQRQFPAWDEVRAKGVFVIAGEFGVWHKTPHAITLDYLEDYLSLWKERDMGWALWEFRGTFGILDSGRADVDYEDYKGHKLDRQMLDLLRRY